VPRAQALLVWTRSGSHPRPLNDCSFEADASADGSLSLASACNSDLFAGPTECEAKVRSPPTVDTQFESDAAWAGEQERSGPSGDASHRAAREGWGVRRARAERHRAVAVLDPIGVPGLLPEDQRCMGSLAGRHAQCCPVPRAEAHWKLDDRESPGAGAVGRA
jgi:hypothetical protein